MILREVTGKEDAMITMMGVPLPAEAIVVDLFSRIFSRQLPTFLLLMFILPLYNTVFAIVKEKESKAKESMRMMGMGDMSYWLSWFVFYATISFSISTIAFAVLSINVIVHSDKIYVWIWFVVHGFSLFG